MDEQTAEQDIRTRKHGGTKADQAETGCEAVRSIGLQIARAIIAALLAEAQTVERGVALI